MNMFEELQVRKSGLEDLSGRFQKILDHGNEALAVVDDELDVILANDSFYQLVSTTAPEDGPTADAIKAFWISAGLRSILRNVFAGASTAKPYTVEFEAPGAGRRELTAHLHYLYTGEIRKPLILIALNDLSNLTWVRDRIEREIEVCNWTRDELLHSDNRFRMLIETMNDGLAVRDEQGLLTYVNSKLCEMSGYSRDEMIGRQVNDFLDPENRQIYREQKIKREEGSDDAYELKITGKDGRQLYALLSPRPIYDSTGTIKGSFAIITDITDRKHMETALRDSEKKLRVLSNHLMMAQEREREHISRELHDQLGQDLAVLKYQIRFIEKRLRKDQRTLKDACIDTLQHIDNMVENVRRISRNLGVHNLRQLGFTDSIRRIAEDFGKHSSTEVQVNMENVDDLLSSEDKTCIYRIFQEALTNIGKHAGATRVLIDLAVRNGNIVCSIEDNGAGFEFPQPVPDLPNKIGMGLTTMEERAQMIGGRLKIASQKGAGTRISLIIPVGEESSSAFVSNSSGR